MAELHPSTSIVEDVASFNSLFFSKYILNASGATYNPAMKYAGDHFESVFASILTSDKRVSPPQQL